METLIVVIEGPSGVGKDSIIKGLVNKYPNIYKKMPSMSSRAKRPSEIEGDPYHFVKKEIFEKMIFIGEIFEYTTHPDGTYRGMSLRIIEEILNKDLIPLKDADMVGVKALKEVYPDKVLTIFVKISQKEINRRLIKRGDDEKERRIRIEDYKNKMETEKYFDYSVKNKNLTKTIEKVHKIIQKRKKK